MMKEYSFDKVVPRNNTDSVKYDLRKAIFGTEDVTPLWVADMDFETPDFIVDAIRRRLDHNIYGYTFVPESFYEALQSWMKKRHQWDIKREWILCCPGVVPSLVMAILSFTEPGDAIVVQPPVYYPFFSTIRDNGRAVINNPLELRDGRLSMGYNHLAGCLDNKAKLLLLCNPHNPGGTVWKREELERLGELCVKSGTIIVSDEIHSDLIFSGHHHLPTSSVSEAISQNTITLISPTKTFNTAGLSISAAIIPNHDLRERFRQTIEHLHLTIPNIFSLVAFESAYGHGENWLRHLLAYLEGNMNDAVDFLNRNIPQIKAVKPEGTYLIWLDCRALGLNQSELMEFMIRQAKVGLNDGHRFGIGGDGFLRLNIACPRSVLQEALKKMEQAVKSLSGHGPS